MIQTISGTHETDVGWYIAKEWKRNTDYSISAPFSAMGWIKDNNLVAQAIFVDYTGSSIEIHINGPGCLNRQTITDVYEYVFKELRCNRLTARVKSDNKRLLALLPRLGFEYEATCRRHYGTPENPIDAILYRLDKEIALEWLYAQRSKATSSA